MTRWFWLSILFLLYAAALAALLAPAAFPTPDGSYTPPDQLQWADWRFAMKKVVFAGSTCKVEVGRYDNGQTALRLFDKEGPVATASAAVENQELARQGMKPLADDEVLIKDYSENRGILDALLKAGVVEKPKDWVDSGYVKLARCKLRER